MAGFAIDKFTNMLLIVVAVAVILLVSTGKLYAVVKPILGWDIRLHQESEDALSKVYDLYRECKESAGVDCTCLGKERIEINEGDRIVIKKDIVGGIRMSLMDEDSEIKFRLLGEVNHCNFPRTVEAVGGEETSVDVVLSTANSELKVDNEILGYTPNPILLYKIRKNEKIAICMITADVFVQQLPKKACF